MKRERHRQDHEPLKLSTSRSSYGRYAIDLGSKYLWAESVYDGLRPRKQKPFHMIWAARSTATSACGRLPNTRAFTTATARKPRARPEP